MSTKAESVPLSPDRGKPDSSMPFDEETTRPVSMQLIARLAAQDSEVALEIGVPESTSEEKKPE